MFLVRWKKTASNKMTDLWLGGDSDLRKAITQAIHSIDQQLQGRIETARHVPSKVLRYD